MVQGIPSIGGLPIDIFSTGGGAKPRTVLLVATSTISAVSQTTQASLSLSAHTYSVANPKAVFDFRSDSYNYSDDFVSGATGIFGWELLSYVTLEPNNEMEGV
jgi:hypothetical protein